jgi:hypothetical protein
VSYNTGVVMETIPNKGYLRAHVLCKNGAPKRLVARNPDVEGSE